MFELIIFFLFASIAVVFALVVILHRNPVVGAIALVVSFFALAVMYVLLDAPFMAALQVIVYAGAIMVLFLFVIMLLNLQHQTEKPTRPIQQGLSAFTVVFFGGSLVYFLAKGNALTAPRVGPFLSDVRAIGFEMFNSYLLPFEMVSIMLLAAIVGALVLTQRSVAR